MLEISLLLTAALLCTMTTHASKVTLEMLTCANQIEGRVGGETNAKVKSTISQLLESVREGDFHGAQRAFKESDVSDRMPAINKYMVDSCGEMRSCMVCPLELA